MGCHINIGTDQKNVVAVYVNSSFKKLKASDVREILVREEGEEARSWKIHGWARTNLSMLRMLRLEKEKEKRDKVIEEHNTDTYALTVVRKPGGPLSMSRVNDGFNPFELLGFLDLARKEIIEMIEGKRKPDIIESKVIVKPK